MGWRIGRECQCWAGPIGLVLALGATGMSPGAIAQGARAEKAPPEDEVPTLADLKRDLRAPFPDARRRAVKRLAQLGTEEAWRLVLAALEDRDGQVADTAQIALATLSEPELLRELLGAAGLLHKDEWVRLRAADVLGRVGVPLDGLELARRFDRRSPALTIALLTSIERLADAGRLPLDRGALVDKVADELARGRDDDVRGVALLTLLALDRAAAERAARDMVGDKAPAVRAAASEVIALVGARDGAAVLQRALADSDPRVRAVALRRVGLQPTKQGLELVAARLASEPRTTLKARLLETLRAATGWRHGANPAAWSAALATVPSDWDGLPLAPPRPSDAAEDRSLAAIGRLDPGSDRLAILIDFSGSLWNVQAGGRTRKELLDPEFQKLVAALTPGGRFNVVPYTGVPHPWQERLVEVEAKLVREAQAAYTRWAMRGQGDAFGAIEVALADPEVDRVLLLTDGAPTGGRRWDLPLAFEHLLAGCRLRPIVYDVVLVDAPKGTARRWERLTSETGGRLLAVSFSADTGAAKTR
jgi:HEAT repeat protein